MHNHSSHHSLFISRSGRPWGRRTLLGTAALGAMLAVHPTALGQGAQTEEPEAASAPERVIRIGRASPEDIRARRGAPTHYRTNVSDPGAVRATIGGSTISSPALIVGPVLAAPSVSPGGGSVGNPGAKPPIGGDPPAPGDPDVPPDMAFAWTELAPSPDSRLIYVSVKGSDSNDGLSPERPVRTIAKALTLIRNGHPDWILLRRGETFNESINWNRNGRSESEPAVLTTYGEGIGRAVIAPGPDGSGLDISARERNFVAFVGLHFQAPKEGTARDGIRIINDIGRHILIEDCKIEGFRNGMNLQKGSNLSIRGCVIVDSAAIFGGHSQGIFAQGITDLLIEGCVLDHNGWRADGKADPTIFNHNAYLRGSASLPMVRTVVRNNIFSRGSSFGCTLSSDDPGGVIDPIVEGNLFVGNANGFVHGGGRSYAIRNTVVRDNVFTQMGRRLNGAPQAFGLLVEAADGALIERNYFIDNDYVGTTFSIRAPSNVNRAQRNVTIRDNVSYGWRNGSIQLVLHDADGYLVGNNLIGDENTTWTLVEVDAHAPGAVTFTSNVYDTDDVYQRWFKVNGSHLSFSGWRSMATEYDARTASEITLSDPNRSLRSYAIRELNLSSVDEYIESARKQMRGHWRSEYSAAAANYYIVGGFRSQDAGVGD